MPLLIPLRHRSAREDPIHSGLVRAAAMMESFWATLKKELVYSNPTFKTRDEARIAIFEYIEVYYNRERLHSSLFYQTPRGLCWRSLKQPALA
jgi:transposase InsO family protein